jgi:hypothetical protein
MKITTQVRVCDFCGLKAENDLSLRIADVTLPFDASPKSNFTPNCNETEVAYSLRQLCIPCIKELSDIIYKKTKVPEL